MTIKGNATLKPSLQNIQAKEKELEKALSRILPGHKCFFQIQFEPQVVKGCCLCSLFELGEIEIRKGLDKTRAIVALRKSGVPTTSWPTLGSF